MRVASAPPPRPPRLATWLAGARLGGDDREFQLGDLDEEFADRAAQDGVRTARRWYWRHAARNVFVSSRRDPMVAADPPRVFSPGDVMLSLRQDVGFALRLMRRAPVATLAAIITFALGIGANVAIFSVAWPVLFAPLPFQDEAGLVTIDLRFRRGDREFKNNVSAGDYYDIRLARSFDGIASYGRFLSESNLTGLGEAQQIKVGSVSDTFFTVLGLAPIAGRPLMPGDADAAEPMLVLKEQTWRRLFGADPAIAGRAVQLDGTAYRIVGVVPNHSGLGTRDADAWVPRADPANALRRAYFLGVVARLKRDVSLDTANAELAGIMATAAQLHPESNRDVGAVASSFREQLSGPVSETFVLLLVAAGAVLLIAALNLSGLQVARGLARAREMTIRTSLGASRGRLVMLVLTENVVIALAGGIVGLGAAAVALRVLASVAPELIWYDTPIARQHSVLIYTVLLSFIAGLLVGALPAWNLSRRRRSSSAQTRGATAGRAATRTRAAIVGVQVAMTVVLLVVASLVTLSLRRVMAVDPGFDLRTGIAADVRLPASRYSSADDRTRFFERLVERVSAIPGVDGACATNNVPLDNEGANMTWVAEGTTRLVGSMPKTITPDCFRVMRLQVLRGRAFGARESEKVAIVSERMATRLWPGGESPIGRRIHLGIPTGELFTVVGLVPNILNASIESPGEQQVWLPHDAGYFPPQRIIVRSASSIAPLTPLLRSALRELDPGVALANVRTMGDVITRATATRRFLLLLFGGFAVVAIALSAVGIYGVLAHIVGQRSREIGIRLALGARLGSVTRLVVGNVAAAVVVGATAGVLLARWAAKWFASLLYEISSTDFGVYAGVVSFVGVIAIVAAWAPTRRAARVNPVSALRAE